MPYLVRNVCWRCGAPLETTVTRKRDAKTLKGCSAACSDCVPESRWRPI